MLDYIRAHVKQAKTAPLAGNSIATDRGFIARDMPKLDDYLHYRMIDVSSIKELCRRWYPRIYFGQPEKGLAHRRARRHPRVDPRAALLPPHRVRAAAGPVDQRDRGDRRRTRAADRRLGGNRFGRRAPERLISTGRCADGSAAMVAVVQLVEHQVVILAVAGSSPVSHPG